MRDLPRGLSDSQAEILRTTKRICPSARATSSSHKCHGFGQSLVVRVRDDEYCPLIDQGPNAERSALHLGIEVKQFGQR
jgi:hypothetical protein